MKIATLTLPTYRYIDTAPLAARYDVLADAVLTFVMAGRLGHAIKATHKVVRLIRTLTKLEAHNAQLKRKLDMLCHKPWRDCVLRELGGMRKLKLWEAAYARILARAAAPRQAPKPQEPVWLYTPERIAESERLKAWARNCSRACHNPLIVRDRCKLDFAGEFRLAPLPRGERAARQVIIYTQQDISDYNWDPTPIEAETGFGPASVWPVEFYAAIVIEARILGERDSLPSVIPAKRLETPTARAGTSLKEPQGAGGPRLRGDDNIGRGEDKIESDVRNDSEGSGEVRDDPHLPLPLNSVLSPKEQRDLLTPLPQEVPFVGS